MVTAMVTATDMTTHMKKMIDIHNHILFSVDDGAKDIQTSIKMLSKCKEQNIKKIILTPHVNSSVSKSNRTDQLKKFSELKIIATKLGIELYLGAEIYISYKLPEINFSEYQMSNKKILLVEFSQYNNSNIAELCHDLIKKGFKIILAHCERYNYLEEEDIIDLINMGVYIQVNASSIIKKKSRKNNSKTIKYLKKGYVDFVATDAHNDSNRPINLLEAYDKTKKLIGEIKTKRLFFENQENLFFN